MATPCRSCGAPMIWGRTERGKNIPLDAQPHPKGNIAFVDPFAIDGLVVFSGPALHDGRPLYVSHYATCYAQPRRQRDRDAADKT